MAESLDVPLPEITAEEFERSRTRFELVAAAKSWPAAKQLAIVPALLWGKLLDFYVDLDDASKSSIATLKNALAQRAGLKKDTLAAAGTIANCFAVCGDEVKAEPMQRLISFNAPWKI